MDRFQCYHSDQAAKEGVTLWRLFLLQSDVSGTMDETISKQPVKTGEEQVGGKFKSGQSGNPKGRPKGARNKATILAEAMLISRTERIMKMWLDMAESGHQGYTRDAVNRLLPIQRQRPIQFSLPELNDTASILKAYDTVANGLSNGELTADEANCLLRLIEGKRSALAAANEGN